MKTNTKRAAFTMIEIIFVLVITGLVATAGSLALVQIMQNYALQKEYAKLELDSTSAIKKISSLLRDSIWDSIAINAQGTYKGINEINSLQNGVINIQSQLIFIEKDMNVVNGRWDASRNANIPYFSGFVDLARSTNRTISTAFPTTNQLNDDLSAVAANGTRSLYFPFVNIGGNVFDKYYGGNKNALFTIVGNNKSELTLAQTPRQIGDIAIIVNSNPSYLTLSIPPTNRNGQVKGGDGVDKQVYDLLFTPEGNMNPNATPSIIAHNVSQFNVWSESSAGVMRVRICFNNTTMSFMPDFCKEGIILK